MSAILDHVKCPVHHGKKEDYLLIDKKTFQIVCLLCQEDTSYSSSSKPKLVYMDVPDDSDWKKCFKHEHESALFYCDDCAQFICKTCFALDHRHHNCSTPDLIVNSIKEKVKGLYNQLQALKAKIEGSTDSIQKINEFYVDQKRIFKTNLDLMNNKIKNALIEKGQEYANEIESFFNGVDSEVELSVQKLDSTRKKANRMLDQFNLMCKEVNEITSDKKICEYKKEQSSVIADNKNFLQDIQNFLKDQLSKTKQKVVQEEENFITKCNNFKKMIAAYESSVINTIVSGIPNVCMRVRRFRKYINSKSKYFKTDSICLLTSNSVNLAGFALCGLISDYNQSTADPYRVMLKIYELDSVQRFDPSLPSICSVEVEIPVITNIVDPVFQFYLKNSITISKNKLYYIIITNISNLTFVNTWIGAVGKEIDDHVNQHSVICNNSNIKFNFLSAFGIESDFNEFSEGIISDIIFSQID